MREEKGPLPPHPQDIRVQTGRDGKAHCLREAPFTDSHRVFSLECEGPEPRTMHSCVHNVGVADASAPEKDPQPSSVLERAACDSKGQGPHAALWLIKKEAGQ